MKFIAHLKDKVSLRHASHKLNLVTAAMAFLSVVLLFGVVGNIMFAQNTSAQLVEGVDNQSDCQRLGDSHAWDTSLQQCFNVAQQTPEGEEPQEQSCGTIVDGIGFAVCPILDAMAGFNDMVWLFIQGLLVSQPLRDNGSFYDLWTALRTIANVVLVIAFIIIIYSQVTGAGVSNYGVKKMLPKVVIVAILINISYFIVALLVDIFNILGTAIYDFLKQYAYENATDMIGWEQLIGLIVGAGVASGAGVALIAAAGGAKAALILIIPAALIAILGFLAAIITLMVRQALIPLLAILSPLAFAAYALPNTEKWFTKWRSLFISMLALYPIAALLIGGLQVAAKALAGDGDNWLSVLMALIVMSAPLFMLPFIARQTGPMLGKLNGALKGFADRAKSPVGGWANKQGALAKARYDSQTAGRRNPIAQLRQGVKGRARRRDIMTDAYNKQAESNFNSAFAGESGGIADSMGDGNEAAAAYVRSIGYAMGDKAEEEQISQQMALFKNTNDPTTHISQAQAGLAAAIDKGDAIGARSYQRILLSTGSKGLDGLQETLGKADASKLEAKGIGSGLRAEINGANLKGKNNVLAGWATQGGSIAERQKDNATFSGLNPTELAGQSKGNLAAAVQNGAISEAQARATLESPTAAASLDTGKTEILQKAAGATPTGNPQTTKETTTESGLVIPHGAAVPQRAAEKRQSQNANPPGQQPTGNTVDNRAPREGITMSFNGPASTPTQKPQQPQKPVSPQDNIDNFKLG